jgi:hypothetical protein
VQEGRRREGKENEEKEGEKKRRKRKKLDNFPNLKIFGGKIKDNL